MSRRHLATYNVDIVAFSLCYLARLLLQTSPHRRRYRVFSASTSLSRRSKEQFALRQVKAPVTSSLFCAPLQCAIRSTLLCPWTGLRWILALRGLQEDLTRLMHCRHLRRRACNPELRPSSTSRMRHWRGRTAKFRAPHERR